MSKFSFIIPVYKVQEYLDKCVSSVREQSYRDIEIILVDDGSPDECPRMCDQYASEDSRIRVIHKPNGGLSDARNKGLEVATGEYVLFVDSDDYVEKNICEKLVPFTNMGWDILIGDATVEGGVCDLTHVPLDGVVDGYTYCKRALQEGKMPEAVWLNVYRREFLLEKNLWFRYGILHEDVEFTPRAFLTAESVRYTGVVLYHYLIRNDSITTRKDRRKNMRDLYETCCELEKMYKSIEDVELRKLMRDTLTASYLSLFQAAKAYTYGREYIHRGFCLRNAKRGKTKLKALLFCLSPRLYWHINVGSKGWRGR